MCVRQSTKYFVVLLLVALAALRPLAAQLPGGDTLATLARVARLVHDSGRTWGPAIWPGFRPDTLPLLYVLPERGTLLFNAQGALPDGYVAIAGATGSGFLAEGVRGAASTAVLLGGRPAAQMVVRSLDARALATLTLHEAFHVFERAVAIAGRRFGQGENAALTATYPAFDAENEAGMALEGKILAAALRASTPARARTLALSYAAVRERRYRALAPEYAEFEMLAELNEGLAEYALAIGAARMGSNALRSESIRRLDSLTGTTGRSLRLRYYSTGSGIALLLDRLQPGWKATLQRDDLTLFEMVARVSGLHRVALTAAERADHDFRTTALRADAIRSVELVKASRLRAADSLLARPGLRIEIDGALQPGKFIGTCGFDPQNMIAVGDGRVIHTRWLRLCGATIEGEFNTPLIQAAGNTGMTASLGEAVGVQLTVSGQSTPVTLPLTLSDARDIRIVAPGLTLTIARGDLIIAAGRIMVRPARAP